MVKLGVIYQVKISGLGSSGEGVGKIDGFTVFVPFALSCELVRVKITLVKSSYAVGQLLEVLQPSADRVKPCCRYFERCGGCQLLHLDYLAQLAAKRQKVIDAIERIGRLEGIEVLPTVEAKDSFYYRNKMMFPVGQSGSKVSIGCYEKASHKVVNIDDCLIQKKANNDVMRIVRLWIDENDIKPYDEKSKLGIVRHVMARVTKLGQVMVCLVVAQKLPDVSSLIASLKAQVEGFSSLVEILKKDTTNVVLSGKQRVLYGNSSVREQVLGLEFELSAKSFFQVNSEQAEVLYNIALDFAHLTGSQNVLEFYCGTGTITLALAKRSKFVLGVELSAQAVEDANANAKFNGIANVQFVCADAATIQPDFAVDVILVDPPRVGCSKEVLGNIAKLKPQKVVYISCNPSTFARDAAIMCEQGYKLQKVQPVDMFPQTFHVECVGLFER